MRAYFEKINLHSDLTGANVEWRVSSDFMYLEVIFHNRFVELKELTEFIGAADLYVTPYLDEAQITSGTLAYAFGAGKAVISTPYWHAAELLADGSGILVPFHDSERLGAAVLALVCDAPARLAMGRKAYAASRSTVWAQTAQRYVECFRTVCRKDRLQLVGRTVGVA